MKRRRRRGRRRRRTGFAHFWPQITRWWRLSQSARPYVVVKYYGGSFVKGFGRRFALPRSKGQTYFWHNMGVCKMRFVHEALLSAKKPCVRRSMQTKCRALFTRINNRLARQIVRDKMNCGVFFVSSPLACLGSMAKGSRTCTPVEI